MVGAVKKIACPLRKQRYPGNKRWINTGYVCILLCIGASRGFAFVEFNATQEAARWMEMKQVEKNNEVKSSAKEGQ